MISWSISASSNRIRFTATVSPVERSSARYTDPNWPFPIQLPSWYCVRVNPSLLFNEIFSLDLLVVVVLLLSCLSISTAALSSWRWSISFSLWSRVSGCWWWCSIISLFRRLLPVVDDGVTGGVSEHVDDVEERKEWHEDADDVRDMVVLDAKSRVLVWFARPWDEKTGADGLLVPSSSALFLLCGWWDLRDVFDLLVVARKGDLGGRTKGSSSYAVAKISRTSRYPVVDSSSSSSLLSSSLLIVVMVIGASFWVIVNHLAPTHISPGIAQCKQQTQLPWISFIAACASSFSPADTCSFGAFGSLFLSTDL